MMKAPDLVTVKEAAARLHCSAGNVRALCVSGKLVATNAFGPWLISADALEKQILESLNRPKLGELRRNAA